MFAQSVFETIDQFDIAFKVKLLLSFEKIEHLKLIVIYLKQ